MEITPPRSTAGRPAFARKRIVRLLLALCGAGFLASAAVCAPPALTPTQAAGCDRADQALQDLAETAFFLQNFRAGTEPSLGHADALDERAAAVQPATGDPELDRVLARVVDAAEFLATQLRAYAPLAETESPETDRAEQDVVGAADALRAALDEAGGACRFVVSAFPEARTTRPNACAIPEGSVLLIAGGEIELGAGESVSLRVSSASHPNARDPLPPECSVSWSVQPGERAAIGAVDGTLAVAADAAVNELFDVRATLADGRTVDARVRVVDRGPGSVVGTFREVSRVPCDGGEPSTPAHPVQELVLGGDGTFAVTWVPFDTRRDYWGTYVFVPETGALSLQLQSGAYVPADLDGDGTVSFDGVTGIRLVDLWLGSDVSGSEDRACTQIFERLR